MSLVNRNQIQLILKSYYVFITIEISNIRIYVLLILILFRNKCIINLENI